MPYASADGVSVYYEVHGTGPALLLAHGAGGHHAIWWQQIPHFSERYRVIAIDLPGFGRSQSDLGTYDAHRYRHSILGVLDDVGVERAALLGQSLGSPPSLSVAVEHPERVAGVILTNSIGGIVSDSLTEMLMADRRAAEQLTVVDRLMSRRFQEERPEMVFLSRQLGTLNTARHADLRNIWEPTTTIDQINGAIDAGVEVCFLGGDQDWMRPDVYREVQALVPRAHVRVVEGAPHSMYWEVPDVFNREVDRFLEAHPWWLMRAETADARRDG